MNFCCNLGNPVANHNVIRINQDSSLFFDRIKKLDQPVKWLKWFNQKEFRKHYENKFKNYKYEEQNFAHQKVKFKNKHYMKDSCFFLNISQDSLIDDVEMQKQIQSHRS